MKFKLFYAIALFALFITSCTKDETSIKDVPITQAKEATPDLMSAVDIQSFEEQEEGKILREPGDYLDISNNKAMVDGILLEAGKSYQMHELPIRVQEYYKRTENTRSVGDKHLFTLCNDYYDSGDLGQELRGWKSGVGHTYLDAASSSYPYDQMHYELDPKSLQNFTQYYGGTPYKYHNYQWINYNEHCELGAFAMVELEDVGFFMLDIDLWEIDEDVTKVHFRSYAENDVGWIVVTGQTEGADEAAVRFSNFVY